jgi:hypothetical protein
MPKLCVPLIIALAMPCLSPGPPHPQNIGGENAGDAFYRYKMPKLMAKVRAHRRTRTLAC